MNKKKLFKRRKEEGALIMITQTRKNLLVTGGYGFIGSNFINYYYFHQSSDFDRLINLDAMYYCASADNVHAPIRNDRRYVFVKGNVVDSDLVSHVLKTYDITHVIHFAAQSHVQNSFEDSIKFTHDNIVGTHTLLECCRKYGGIERFIHVSTDEVYGESMNTVEESHKTEHSILCPTNPYAATKAGAELIAQSYCHSYKMPIIITRGNNVYGRGQYPEKLIPRFIQLLKQDKKVTVQGRGDSVRAFLHAYDTAKAFATILHKGKVGEIYNIGCDEGMEYSVLEIAHILIRMIKGDDACVEDWIEFVEDRPYNDRRYYISNQKIKELGWSIQVDLKTGLQDLIHEHFKINLLDLMIAESNPNKLAYFGDWIHQENMQQQKYFLGAAPFEHIVLPNFLEASFAEKVYEQFPLDMLTNDKWHRYENPIEYKFAFDDIQNLPEHVKQLFYLLSTREVIEKISALTAISDLEFDPYLHGAGVHVHPRKGRLHMHLDYEKHPHCEKQRRINIILYMSKDWRKEWHGHTQLWDKDMQQCVAESEVQFNTAIVFKTNEISWHGLPEPISCPEGVYRKSVAYYYVSPLVNAPDPNKVGSDATGYRKKATFVRRPNDKPNEKVDELYKIRPHRLITTDDLKRLEIPSVDFND